MRRTHYFGSWSDGWKLALERYLETKDDLYAGRKPRQRSADGHRVYDSMQLFLHDKRALVDSGELSERTWEDYKGSCQRIVAKFGKHRQIEDLRPDDFAELRAELAENRTLSSLGNEVGRIRAVFNHLKGSGVITEIGWGNQFKKPSAKVLRVERSKKGPQDIPARVIVCAAGAASDAMSAMILLGINCGLGNTDCAKISMNNIDWSESWLNYPRPKTGVDRRAKLWPETMAALRSVYNAEQADPLFVTKYGRSWEGAGRACPISAEFRKTLKLVGCYREGHAFYSLRRTFQTVAEESGDFPAISMVMGHDDGSMATRYRQRISDARLERVAETVRQWLLEGIR